MPCLRRESIHVSGHSGGVYILRTSSLNHKYKSEVDNLLEINKIYNMDCLEGMKYIDDKSIDMILCDLPYGTTACKWDSVIPFKPLWQQYERIIKDSGAIVLFGSEPFSSNLRMSNLKMFKYDWIWNKKKGGNPLLSKIQPIKTYEIISVFGKGKVNYYPIMVDRDKPKARGRNKGKISETTNNAFTENIEFLATNGNGVKINVRPLDKCFPSTIFVKKLRDDLWEAVKEALEEN